jgi:hypothetical protein
MIGQRPDAQEPYRSSCSVGGVELIIVDRPGAQTGFNNSNAIIADERDTLSSPDRKSRVLHRNAVRASEKVGMEAASLTAVSFGGEYYLRSRHDRNL